jgi:hypothetical protein
VIWNPKESSVFWMFVLQLQTFTEMKDIVSCPDGFCLCLAEIENKQRTSIKNRTEQM